MGWGIGIGIGWGGYNAPALPPGVNEIFLYGCLNLIPIATVYSLENELVIGGLYYNDPNFNEAFNGFGGAGEGADQYEFVVGEMTPNFQVC
jgi:hypothetical protein